jgi:hypothetical protein
VTKHALVTASDALPAGIDDLGEGLGLERVKANDVVIPRLTILQGLSPQLKPSRAEYIEGAKPGMFCDTATGDLFESLNVIPCFYSRVYLEWPPQRGKGLVANHGTDDSIMRKVVRDERFKARLPNGNYIAETATFYVLNLTAGGRPSFIPLTSTNLKAAKRWMTLIMAQKAIRSDGTEFTPPIFYRSWNVTTTNESNDSGDWFGWRFSPGPTILDPELKPVLPKAKQFFEQARDNLVQGDVGSMAEDVAPSDERF